MLVILGNQLFSPEHLPAAATTPVFMAEDLGLCTYVRHHQQKIVLFLAAMRSYADAMAKRYAQLPVPGSQDGGDAAASARGAEYW